MTKTTTTTTTTTAATTTAATTTAATTTAATTMTTATTTMLRWTAICRLGQLLPERGAAALVGDAQVAVFRLHDDTVHALGNRDPVSGACVLSRGIVGTRGDIPVVVSPMHKQAYDLRTGACLDEPAASVPVYAARVRDGVVEVALPT